MSLKQALAVQRFKGGSRGDTEWNQWVQSQKSVLPLSWSGTALSGHIIGHMKNIYLSLLIKKQRQKEVIQPAEQIAEKRGNIKYCPTLTGKMKISVRKTGILKRKMVFGM